MDVIAQLKSLLRGKSPSPLPAHSHTWPEKHSDRRRVLIENPDAADLWAHADALREAGYEVATCIGPAATPERESRLRRSPSFTGSACPLLGQGSCPLVDGADVVVSTTQLPHSREILAALTSRHSPPVVVEGATMELERSSDVTGDATKVEHPVTPEQLLAAVDKALSAAPPPR